MYRLPCYFYFFKYPLGAPNLLKIGIQCSLSAQEHLPHVSLDHSHVSFNANSDTAWKICFGLHSGCSNSTCKFLGRVWTRVYHDCTTFIS
ncbi:hypothetical protein OIU74_028739 [Salix koriyanagi]|uniref:Uncharacterized protein n=1 Tax=Salix koriyanagi TaxID=2511006 RepID=A0A9Q0VCC7_9ROSI|nr:hypothetical protein OIU74_028739 [Salix koriyanagi]